MLGKITEFTGTTQTFKVTGIIRHEDYSMDTYENDVALMFLDGEAPCAHDGGATDLVELDRWNDDSYEGRRATAVGWGGTERVSPAH